MLNLLATRYAIPRERCGIAGYADTMPVDSNETPEGRARNRRVDIVNLNDRVWSGLSPFRFPPPRARLLRRDSRMPPGSADEVTGRRSRLKRRSNCFHCCNRCHASQLNSSARSITILILFFRFPPGLPGFDEEREFLFLKVPASEPVMFLQSISMRSLCFVLVPILTLVPNFPLALTPEELHASVSPPIVNR